MNASTVSLDELVGKRVRSLMDFSGIPKGTEGVVKSHYIKGIPPHAHHEGIMVEWTTTGGTLCWTCNESRPDEVCPVLSEDRAL